MPTLRYVLIAVLLSACVADDEQLDTDTVEQEVSAAGPAGTVAVIPVSRRTSWQYYDGAQDQGTAWRTKVPLGWPGGAGPLGYGESYIATTISFGDNSSIKHPTAYFRTLFGIGGSWNVRAMFLRVMYDDGFVFYINGKEGGRANMPAGAVTFNTLASSHEAENRYVTYDISSQIPNLVTGTNALGVEVHQTSTNASSDLVFDAELIVWVDNFPIGYTTDGIQKGSYWQFWDRGGAPPATGWSAGRGPLGFGEDYVVTDSHAGPITTYFRADFQSTGEMTQILGNVMYDDGFVAYLNGVEIGRSSMPAGAVGPTTLAFGHEAAGYQLFDWSAKALAAIHHDGSMNTLMVEVHQSSTTSSDLVFDLELMIDGAWFAQNSGTTQGLRDVWATDAFHSWVVGEGGTILRTSNGGATWTAQASGTTGDLAAITFPDAQHGWIVGHDGSIIKSVDGGETWQRTFLTTELTGLWFIGPEQGWITAGSDIVYGTQDGFSYTPFYTGTGGSFEDVSFADANNGWIVGAVPTDGDSQAAIYATHDGGWTWTQQFISGVHHFYLHDVEALDASTAWAVGQGSLSGTGEKKLVTHDGGETWTLLPETANGGALEALDFVDAQHGWAVGFYGSIIATDDGGASWHVQEQAVSYEKPWFSGVHFADLKNGWVVGEGGAIWHTTSGGEGF
jgi:photosystem II stability/assembly factor-like uncharacterized protein